MAESTAEILSDEELTDAAQLACLLEASAPKPGNVSRYRDFNDTSFEDFLISAIAIGRAIRRARWVSVGETIWKGIYDTRRLVGSNTNLGIVLLLAPLAKAYGRGVWRKRLAKVLADLTIDDARQAYQAIRLAAPAGLGHIEEGDVAEEPQITLGEAMALAKDRDTIAREYASDFAVTFELACPTLRQYWKDNVDFSKVIVQTYLTILAEIPDTLVVRKNGPAVAEEVSQRASEAILAGGVFSSKGRRQIEELDRFLCDETHHLNPGTTADLVTAGLFVVIAEGGLDLRSSEARLERRYGEEQLSGW